MKTLSMTVTRRGALGLLAGAVAAPALVRRSHAAEVTLKLHHMLPPVSPAHRQIFEPLSKLLAEQSGGRIDVQIFPSMQLGGKPPQLIDQVRDGVADIVWALPVYNPGRFPLVETASIPFMVTSAEATSVALHKFMETEGAKEFADYKPLAYHVHAPGKFHMVSKKVETAADLKGLRIRAPNQSFGEALSILGADPVFFPVTEMATGLANGLIDGTCLPYEVVPAFKLHELTKFHCGPVAGSRGLYANSFAFLMNKAKYDAMPDDLKKIVDDNTGVGLARKIGKAFDDNEQVGYDLCKKRGNTFVDISLEEVESWRKTTRPVIDNWIKMLDGKGHDGAATVARLEALIAAETKA